ncbi:hypothetical protein Mlaev_00644 [Microbacterium laevaniformans]|uniref:Uncharacterized protein n=1 Tax=Microbacterium laevaniformans TaxID=36807 RepID=A0A150HH72_9MICO|nr:hypothetical protein Mlaev_00644 [Microbacterium laevaniformans]
MRGVDDLTTWRLGVASSGNGLPSKVKVYSPGCAASPHAERDCRCRTFPTRGRANEYIEDQSRIDSDTV